MVRKALKTLFSPKYLKWSMKSTSWPSKSTYLETKSRRAVFLNRSSAAHRWASNLILEELRNKFCKSLDIRQ